MTSIYESNEQNRDSQCVGLRWTKEKKKKWIAHRIPIRLCVYSNQIRSFLTDFLSIVRNSGYLGKFCLFFCLVFTSAAFSKPSPFLFQKKVFFPEKIERRAEKFYFSENSDTKKKWQRWCYWWAMNSQIEKSQRKERKNTVTLSFQSFVDFRRKWKEAHFYVITFFLQIGSGGTLNKQRKNHKMWRSDDSFIKK